MIRKRSIDSVFLSLIEFMKESFYVLHRMHKMTCILALIGPV